MNDIITKFAANKGEGVGVQKVGDGQNTLWVNIKNIIIIKQNI